MIIYFYLFIPLLFATIESSSIRGRNNKNELVPFMSSRSDPEKKDSSVKIVGSEPFFVQLLPNSGKVETRGKDMKKKRPSKKRISKIKALRKRQRTRRELQVSKPRSTGEEFSNPLESPKRVNASERLQNHTNAINRTDILKVLSNYSKAENKESNNEDVNYKGDQRNDHETGRHMALIRNHPKHTFSERKPLVKMVYPSTPKPDRHPHKYTYRDLITDRERLEQKINYIKNMLSLNESVIDDAIRVRRRSDSDRIANKMAKMFLTLSAVNEMHDRRKSKCEKDEDDDNRIWEKERRDSLSRKSSSSNAERYKVKKWIEFMKNKRSSGKTCPCMASYGEERDVFPLEQKLPKGYFLMERRDSSEESAETYKDPFNSSRDKPNRENNSRRRLNKNQEDQDSKLKAPPKNGKKKPDVAFTDLELYRSRAKQILRNAEEILDRIKEEEEKRLSVPNLFMNQLKELTSRIQGDPRNNENDLIRKLQKNLGWGPLARSEEGADGNQFMENVKSFILDPYEKAKALTDESAKKLSSYLLWNLGKIQASEEQTEGREADDENGKANLRVYFGQVPPKEDEKPIPDSLAKAESETDSINTEKSDTDKEEAYKQKVEDIIKEQQKILNEYKMTQDSEESRKDMEEIDDKETVTVRENQNSNLEDKVALQLKEHDTDRNTEPGEKAIKSGEESEKVRSDFVEGKPPLHPEGTSQGEKGDIKGTASGNMQAEENVQEQKIEEFMKAIKENTYEKPGDDEKVEQRSDQEEDSMAQSRQELIQAKHDSESTNEQEEMQVVASSKNTLEEISERDENDVLNSPHLNNDYDFLDVKETDESGPSGTEDGTQTVNNSYVQAVAEEATQAKSGDETVLETKENFASGKSEAESGLNPSKEVSRMDGTEIIGLQEPALKNSMERNESSMEEKQEAVTVEGGTKQNPEYSDLVKEVNQAFEVSNIQTTPDKSSGKSNEETDETLEMVRSDNENDQLASERTDRANKDGETLLKLASDIQDSQNLEENDDQEESSETLLSLYENSEEAQKEMKPAHDNHDRQNIENTYDTLLKAESPEIPAEESSEETLLEEALENRVPEEGDGVPLRAEKPTEADSEELVKSADEDSNAGAHLEQEAKENSEVPLLAAMNNVQETDQGEESFKENNNNNKEIKANEEDSEWTPVKAVHQEDLEKDFEALTVGNPNKKDGDDTENIHDITAKESSENVEETLKSEYVVSDEEKETSQEIIGKEMPEENEKRNEENTTFEEYTGHENDNKEKPESLDKDQSNLEEETILKVGNPKESSIETGEITDNEATVRAQNTHLKKEEEIEVQTSSSQENLEERNEGTALQRENAEDKVQEQQNSNETLQKALENEAQESAENVEDDEKLKAANPDNGNQDLKEEYSNEDDDKESVKAVFEDQEGQDGDQQIVKAEMENVQDSLEDDEALKAENFVEEVQEERNSSEDDKYENVKAAFKEENREDLAENDENLKSEKSEENSESDGVLREALENSENVEDQTFLKKTRMEEELKDDEEKNDNENEELKENKSTENEDDDDIVIKTLSEENPEENLENKSTENADDDDIIIKTLSEENLEEEDQTLQSENPSVQEKQKESNNDELQLRKVSMEDDLNNKIDDESHLRSSNPIVEIDDKDHSKSLSEEMLREESSNNEVQESETLKLKHLDVHQFGKSSTEDDLLGENAAGDDDSLVQDVNLSAEAQVQESGSHLSDLLQMPEPSSKSLKGNTLKVPKSIAEIMNDLEGKTKDDVASLQKLNPDKIDHIIDKIDKAEQKNLLENQETDCMKECACAEEMNTRSRNIGRYEIVKDFLHWMKDLQLNRVLSDD